nr:immunoglobulin light chain junction region [Macaca mulatta]MOX08504.1 immunoglobulin light chain junction region [Macaca mulatta]MOX08659.1 immunoglobulin light chain junction region [Macaca mulatta]
CQQYSDYPYSF